MSLVCFPYSGARGVFRRSGRRPCGTPRVRCLVQTPTVKSKPHQHFLSSRSGCRSPTRWTRPLALLPSAVASPRSKGAHDRWSRWWGTTTGALHRLIFAVVVGLGALAVSTVLWVVSFPLVAWKLSLWLPRRFARKHEEGDDTVCVHVCERLTFKNRCVLDRRFVLTASPPPLQNRIARFFC